MTTANKLVLPLAAIGLSFGHPVFAADGTRSAEALPNYSAVHKLAEVKPPTQGDCRAGDVKTLQGTRSGCRQFAAASSVAGPGYAGFLGGGGLLPIGLLMVVVGVAGAVALGGGGSDSPG